MGGYAIPGGKMANLYDVEVKNNYGIMKFNDGGF